jgi:hypothetical protein
LNHIFTEKVKERMDSNTVARIHHLQAYSMLSRVLRQNAWLEPFNGHHFSSFAMNPTFANRQFKAEEIIVESVGNDRDKKKLDKCLKMVKGRNVGLRIETIVNVNWKEIPMSERSFDTLFRCILEPFKDTLESEVNRNRFVSIPIKKAIALFPTKKFIGYWYCLNTILYNALLKLTRDLARPKPFISSQNLVMVQLFERLLSYSLNGYSMMLPTDFMFANRIVLGNGFVHIPSELFDAKTGKVIMSKVARSSNNGIIHPFPLKVQSHRFPSYVGYMDKVSLLINGGNLRSVLRESLKVLLDCVTEEAYQLICCKVDMTSEQWNDDEREWIEYFLQNSGAKSRMSVVMPKVFIEIGKCKDSTLLDMSNILKINDVATLLWKGEMDDLPHSSCLREHIKSSLSSLYGPESILEGILRQDDAVVFEYWFRENSINFKSVRLVENICIPYEKIRQAYGSDCYDLATFEAALNYRDDRDEGDWYQETSNPRIVPFQLNKLLPMEYEDLKSGIESFCKKRPGFIELLNLYNEHDVMDQFILIWCLKSIIKPTSYTKRISFSAPKGCSNRFFAAALFLAYLSIKSGNHDVMRTFELENQSSWKISKRYLTDMQIISNNNFYEAAPIRDWGEKMELISLMYEARNEDGLKNLLDY